MKINTTSAPDLTICRRSKNRSVISIPPAPNEYIIYHRITYESTRNVKINGPPTPPISLLPFSLQDHREADKKEKLGQIQRKKGFIKGHARLEGIYYTSI